MPGLGLLYSPGLEPLLRSSEDLVSYVEVEPQTLWRHVAGAERPYAMSRDHLERIRSLPQTKIVHGVGFPVGGTIPPDPRQVAPLVEVVRALDAPWCSEHLAFNRARGPHGERFAGFLLPPFPSPAGVDAAVRSIRTLTCRLPVPFLFETGVDYLKPRPGEMPDGAFAAAVATRADCGILLDLHNLYANERNGRQPVREFLADVPLDRVVEIHVAGGVERDGYWLDAHSAATPDEVLELLTELVPALPNLRAVVFELLGDYVPRLGIDGVRDELERLSLAIDSRSRGGRARRERRPRPAGSTTKPVANDAPLPTPAEWEDALATLAIGRTPECSLGWELALDDGVSILRDLVWHARAGMIVDALTLTCRLLRIALGDAAYRDLIDRFCRTVEPELFASDEATSFALYLCDLELDVDHLDEIVRFEIATLRVAMTESTQTVGFSCEPMALIESLAEGRRPGGIPSGAYELEITPTQSGSLRPSGLPPAPPT